MVSGLEMAFSFFFFFFFMWWPNIKNDIKMQKRVLGGRIRKDSWNDMCRNVRTEESEAQTGRTNSLSERAGRLWRTSSRNPIFPPSVCVTNTLHLHKQIKGHAAFGVFLWEAFSISQLRWMPSALIGSTLGRIDN